MEWAQQRTERASETREVEGAPSPLRACLRGAPPCFSHITRKCFVTTLAMRVVQDFIERVEINQEPTE